MKMITCGAVYAISGVPRIRMDTVEIPLADAPATIGETVELADDSGNHLRTFTTADFLRAYMDGATLVLTQTPEPEPVPEPVDPGPTEVEQLRADVDYLAAMSGIDLEATE